MLTAGVDSGAAFTGGAGNDTFKAGHIENIMDIGGVATDVGKNTLGALDELDGGAGVNTLQITTSDTAAYTMAAATLKNIQNITVKGGGDVTAVTTGTNITGLEKISVLQSADATLTVSATQNAEVSGATGDIVVKGGKDIVVTDATDGKNITIGSATPAEQAVGTITVTDSKQGSGTIDVDGGSTVTVTASTEKAASGGITVGSNKAATGAVTVTQNTTSDASTAGVVAGNIVVTGGSTVTVNVNSTNTATKDSSAANDITAGTVTVTGDSKTTAVTVNQTHVANDYAAVTTGASKETSAITFASLKAGEKIAVSAGALSGLGTDLTFTAGKDLTAAEVAAAFAGLTAADTQVAGGKVANGIYTGKLDAGWTSGAVSGSTVTFSSVANANETNEITLTVKKADGTTNVDNITSFTTVKVDGSAGTSTTARDVTGTNGAVVIDDNATAAITDVTINGYATAAIGATQALTKLANLSLANSGGSATVDAAAGITSLNLTVNKVNHAVVVSTDSTTVSTLNVTATGADSSFALTAANVKDLTVAGDKALTLTGATTALETVKVTGTASLNISGVSANAAKSIDTTGTTGAVTASIDGTAATYTGGAGVDTVTLVTGTALTKAIDLGAGDDTLVFGAVVTGSSAALNGGDGIDTLSMTTANADALDATAQTFYTNFERLTLNNANTAALTIDTANLGFTNYVTTSGTAGVTYTDATAYVATDKVSVVINGKLVTATLPATPNTANITAALNAAADTAFGTTGVTYVAATLTNSDKTLAVVSANPVAYTVTAGTMTDTSNVDLDSTITEAVLTLNNLANNATVVLTKDGSITAVIKDAATGSADVLSVVANVSTVDKDFGTLTAANIETVSITANDTVSTGGIQKTTLALVADKATTVNLGTSSAAVDLTLTGSTKVTLIDGSLMTGGLTATTTNTTAAETIKGGAGVNMLTAATNDAVLVGGIGNDTLTVTSGLRVNLHGGAGADKFVINATASLALDAYTVINGVDAGDVIQMGAATNFISTKIALSVGADESLLNYANQAANTLGVGEMGWFQKGGNTYIVLDQGANSTAGFVADEDMIIMITGVHNLDTGASYNATSNTLEII